MKKKFKEWISIQMAKKPGRMVLIGILLFNVLFFLVSALVMSSLSLEETKSMNFFEAAYYTITMILDAGSISAVIEDIGTTGVAIVIVCLLIILIGMITFTGAVIGYITNWISNFIANANAGSRKLRVSDHIVILNWNTRASEIVNDLLFTEQREKVVILVGSRKEEIEKEISERLSDTIAKENTQVVNESRELPFFKRIKYILKHRITSSVTFIVREGDVFSLKQLRDIQIEQAKSVLILGDDVNTSVCKYENQVKRNQFGRGNPLTIKTLMQVADITAAEYSADSQRIIVEVTDVWTKSIVDKIIRSKQIASKCHIVPVYVNEVLGQLLSQFSLMPELNLVYRELFSNKGGTFYEDVVESHDDETYIKNYLKTHKHAIPLASVIDEDRTHFFYVSDSEKNIGKESEKVDDSLQVDMNYDYWIEDKNVIILGHNSDMEDIMKGFLSFTNEWGHKNSDEKILTITVVDDEEYLAKMDYYRKYPFVVRTVVADIYDKDTICEAINQSITGTSGDTSILILSDDSAINENIDASALTNLVYVQDIIKDKIETIENFDVNSIDVIVEIIDPKHHDIVNGYDINNVVISNRYISKMITQIGEKETVYNFYSDILTFDAEDSQEYESKEVYIKKVSAFFNEIPPKCTADRLIRGVYEASVLSTLPRDKHNPTLLLGYVKANGEMVIFSSDQSQYVVELKPEDKIIVYSTH